MMVEATAVSRRTWMVILHNGQKSECTIDPESNARHIKNDSSRGAKVNEVFGRLGRDVKEIIPYAAREAIYVPA